MIGMILAAGRGQRLMPITQKTPKSLLQIKGVTLIEHAINRLKQANIVDIVINVCYLGDQIQSYLGNGSAWGVRITYSIEQSALETAGGIINALPLLGDEPFIVTNSDILCNYDLSQLALPKKSLAHLILVKNPAHNPTGDFALKQQRITFKRKSHTFAGIGIYHPKLFKAYSGNKQKLPLRPLLKMAAEKNQLSGELYSDYWQDIGTLERLALASQHK